MSRHYTGSGLLNIKLYLTVVICVTGRTTEELWMCIKVEDDPDASIVMDLSWILQETPDKVLWTPDARLLCEMRQLSGLTK